MWTQPTADLEVDLHPVVIEGAFDLHPPNRWTTEPGHVRIRVLPARPMVGLDAETIPAEIEALRKVYEAELQAMRSEKSRSAEGRAALSG